MVKVRRIAGKAVSLILAVTMFASLIDIRAFADAGAVSYEGTEYDTIEEALSAAEQAGDVKPAIQILNNVILQENVSVKAGYDVTVNAPEDAVMEVETDSEVFSVAAEGTLTVNNLSIVGNTDGVTVEEIKNVTTFGSRMISNSGTLQLNNVTIRNFKAQNGVIYLDGGRLVMDGLTKISNMQGRAIWTTGESWISGGTMEKNNSVTSGTAIYARGKVCIEGITFNENTSTTGTIYGTRDINIKDCTFDSNSATNFGGAITTGANYTTSIYNTSFINSINPEVSSRVAAGINVSGNSRLVMGGVTFDGCRSGSGSAVTCGNGTITLLKPGTYEDTAFGSVTTGKNTFTGCASTGTGGAIYLGGDGILEAEQAEFTGNSASQGGAVYSKGEVNIHDVTMEGNVASDTNTANENRVTKGNGIYNGGTVNLYANADMKDQIFLEAEKKVTVREKLNYHMGTGDAVKIAVNEKVTDEFRLFAEYNTENPEDDAYQSVVNGVWKLESVSEERNRNIIADGNSVGIATLSYEKSVACKDENGDGVGDVVFELFKEEDTAYVSMGNTPATDKDGNLLLEKLTEGNYYLKQSNLPEGYEKDSTARYEFSVGNEAGSETLTIEIGSYNEAPHASITIDRNKAAIGESIIMSASASYDDGGIVSYEWDFGDTKTASGAEAEHTYAAAGNYIIMLTVKDEKGRSDTTKKEILIDGTADGYYTLKVDVKSTNTDEAIPNAAVYVYDEDENPVADTYVSAEGSCEVVLKAEKNYIVTALANGYYARTTSLRMPEEATDIIMYLSDRETIAGEMTSEEMTLEEMKEKGLDIYADGNRKIFKHNVTLAFANKSTGVVRKIEYYTASDDLTIGEGRLISGPEAGGGYVQGELFGRCIYFLVIEGTTKWMKDMFHVSLIVINNSSAEYVSDCKAELNLPYGLSMAEMLEETGNEALKELGNIPAGESREVDWYVRGDEDGVYNISSTVSGEMKSDVTATDGQAFTKTFTCDSPLRVMAGSSMTLEIEVNANAKTGDSYPVTYTYTNVSDKPIYNLQFYFDREIQYANDGAVFNYCEPDTYYEEEVLEPGESFSVRYSTVIKFRNIYGDEVVVMLMAHAFETLPGSNASIPCSFKVINNPISMPAKDFLGLFSVKSYSGDPVNMLTGTLDYEYTDYTLKGRHDLEFTRLYNSGNKEDTGMGQGWTNNHDYSLKTEETGETVISYPDGGTVTFYKDRDGKYIQDTTYGRTIAEEGGNTVFREAGRTFTFNGEGRLTGLTEDDGWQTTYDYEEGNLTKIESHAGVINLLWESGKLVSIETKDAGIRYGYDEKGNLKELVNADGDPMAFTYDENGYLTSITDFEGIKYMNNTYDESGRVLIQTIQDEGTYEFSYDDNERVNTCTGENDYFHIVKYDEQFRIISDEEDYLTEYLYNPLGQLICQEDPDGKTVYSYDGTGNIHNVLYPDGTTDIYTYDAKGKLKEYKNRNDKITKYVYNSKGLRIKETDPRGNTVTYEYDADGNRKKEKSAEGKVTEYAYTGAGLVTKKKDAQGREWEYFYDDSGRLIKEIKPDGSKKEYTYTTAGKLKETRDDKEQVTAYGINGNGYTTQVTDKNGGITKTGYNAMGQVISEETPQGYVTKYEYDKRGNLIKQTFSDDSSITYVYDRQGNIISETDGEGRKWEYTYDEKGRLKTVTNPLDDVKSYEYDKNGKLKAETDENGETTDYVYDAVGNLLSETDPLDNSIYYEYDGNGNKTGMTDKNGNVTVYVYDRDNRLVREESEKGSISYSYDGSGNLLRKEETGDIVTCYDYDDAGNLILMTDPEGNETAYDYDSLGNLLSVTYPNGGTITYTYDKKGNRTSVTDSRGFTESYVYDRDDRIISKEDNNGNRYAYGYDFRGNETKVTTELSETTRVYDGRGLLTEESNELGTRTYEYDASGRLKAEVSPGGSRREYTYDKAGNLTETKDGNGNVTKYSYDGAGQVIQKTDPEGGTEIYAYDGNGNMTRKTDANGKVTEWTYDSMNNIISEKDASGNTRSWKYDFKGNLTEYTDAEGAKTEYTYDKNGNCTAIKDALGNTATYEYNSLGKVVKETSAGGVSKYYTYDLAGNLSTERDGRGNVTGYEYDGNGNRTKKEKGLQSESYTYDSADRLTQTEYKDGTTEKYTYDVNGNRLTYRDRNGNVTTYEYDGDNNLTKTTDALGNETSYEYDGEGNLTKVVMYRDRNDDSTREETVYEYDGNNRLVKETNAIGTVTLYEYDGNGNLMYKKDEAGNIMGEYTYTDTNLLKTKKEGTELTKAVYCYNKNGELVSMETPDAAVSYTRDELNRITEVNVDYYTVKNEYDADSNRTKIIYPDGSEVSYTYDGNGNIKTITDASNITEYYYDGNDNRTRTEVDGLLTNTWLYDSNGNLVNDYAVSESGSMSLRDMYTYDGEGNITNHRLPGSNREYDYTYDGLGRLKTETGTEDGETYTKEYFYDGAGNIVNEVSDGEKYIYEYNNANQLLRKYKESDVDASGYVLSGTKYRYSRNGYMGEKLEIWGATSLFKGVYDSEGKLLEAAKGRQVQETYGYDGLGNEVKKNTVTYSYDRMTDITTTRIYDYAKEVPTVLAEYSTDSTMIMYTYGEDNRKVSATVKNNMSLDFITPKKYTFENDVRGSVREVKNSEGEIVATAEYDTWGNVTSETGIYINANVGSVMLATSYTGYIYNRALGWWNAGARNYDPTSRRFNTPDPERGNVYEPLRINRYTYAGNDPVNNVDPDGRSHVSLSGFRSGFSKVACGVGKAWQGLEHVVKSIADSPAVRQVKDFVDSAWEAYDNLPGWAKAGVGTAGLVVYGLSGAGTVATVTLAVTALATGAVEGGIGYALQAVSTGNWDNGEFLKAIGNGALNSYGLAGLAAGASGAVNLVKNNPGLSAFLADETGSISFDVKGSRKTDKVLGGSFKDVNATRGADEVGHHMPQYAYDKMVGISRNDGPALLMSKEDHALTRSFAGRGKATMKEDIGLSARQRMVKDLWDIKDKFGTKYNEGIKQMLEYAKTLPEFQK